MNLAALVRRCQAIAVNGRLDLGTGRGASWYHTEAFGVSIEQSRELRDEAWARVGVDQLVLMIQAGATTHDQVLRAIELRGVKVLPRVPDTP